MEAQYCQPTEIQRQTIDFALQGKDVLERCSGKTLAFLIPVLECLSTAMDGLGALIISPTRELAYQTSGCSVKWARTMSSLPASSLAERYTIYFQVPVFVDHFMLVLKGNVLCPVIPLDSATDH
ncbi:unnamed protein product [Oncorhynchus mykiss]|uniref:ATP-dependent RNA helicase n=1 Tax=Oncorhynchus mykiss TaxID=8022 RepID=A0A060X167_ONCMY|nr:unnamed protein product [Oncorhynchus mykiss]